jgi:predicted ester cyclase
MSLRSEIPASGKTINVPVADFFRLSQGRIVEHWGVSDIGSLMQQLRAA